MEKSVGSALELSTKGYSHMTNIDKNIWVENSVFAIQHGGNRKKFFEMLSPLPSDQAIRFCVQLQFYITHIIYKMACLVNERRLSKCSNRIYYKSS